MLGGLVPADKKFVRLYLPIGAFPKGPLLDFNLSVDGRPAFLLPRGAHGARQARYLGRLAARAAVPPTAATAELLTIICGFTSGLWLRELYKGSSNRERSTALYQYLNGGLKGRLGQDVSRDSFLRWEDELAAIRELVRRYGPADTSSAAENPLLALPLLPGQRLTEASLTARIVELADFLRRAHSGVVPKDPGNASLRLLETYSEYGRHWEALAECSVPLDRPFLIKVSEKRALQLKEPGDGPHSNARPLFCRRTTPRQLLVMRDARSNHVSVRVADPNVELTRRWRLYDERRRPTQMLLDDARASPEVLAFYDSKPTRDYRVWLDLPVRLDRTSQVTNGVIMLLMVTAVLGFLTMALHYFHVGGHKRLNGADVAVLLVPSAVAAALLLVRDSSTLGTEVNKRFHLLAALLLFGLWILSLAMYVLGRVVWGGA